jgi:hypothetical protein
MIMKMKTLCLIASAGATLFLTSCRGDKSSEPPVLLMRNMVDQTSYGPQSSNQFFKNKMAARAPVAGTVAEGEEHNNKSLFYGIEQSSSVEKPVWISKFPLILTSEFIKRGQDRYNIYCAPCHGIAGNSDGMATQVSGGSIRPAHLHDKEIIQRPVGKIYDAITNGVNNWNMPGFSEQMSLQDRWAVVAYVRALQLSQNAVVKSISKDKTK